MVSTNSDADSALPGGLKVVIAGGFGVGKTTLVAAVSDIDPVSTEAVITEASRGVDDVALTGGKATTTVAMDFGRINIASSDLVLYLFGLPGQRRFWFLWDQMCLGALGVVVLVDTRRIEDSFDAVDYFEQRRLPFLVAVNHFDGGPRYPEADVRAALRLDVTVPVLTCDARARTSAVAVLIALVRHLQTYDYEAAPTAVSLTQGIYT